MPHAVGMVGADDRTRSSAYFKKRGVPSRSQKFTFLPFSLLVVCIFCLISSGTDSNSFDTDSMDWVLAISGLTLQRKCIYSLTHSMEQGPS